MSYSSEKSTISISNLIDKCIDGDRASWELFFINFHRLVTGVVNQRSFSSKEDTVQIIYLKLLEDDYKLLRKFHGTSYGEFLLYLKEICKNIVRDENKKYQKKTRLLEENSFNESKLIDPKSIEPPGEEGEKELLFEKIMQLELGFREVMILKVNGYKAREISEILDIPLNTVLTRVKRSIEKIKKNI